MRRTHERGERYAPAGRATASTNGNLWRDARVCAAFASETLESAASGAALVFSRQLRLFPVRSRSSGLGLGPLRPPAPRARVISHILMYYKHIQAEPCTAELQTGRGHFQAVMHTAQAWDVEGAETGPPAGRARRARRVRCGGTDRERTAGPVHAHKSAGPRRHAAPQLLYCRAAFWRILASPTPGGCASTWRTWRATSVLSRVRGTKPGRPWLAHRSAFTVVASTLARVCLFHFRACVGSCGGAAWRTLLPKARAKSYKVSVGVVDAELAADGCAHLCGGLTIER